MKIQGFTLVEIIVILLVVFFLIFIALPITSKINNSSDSDKEIIYDDEIMDFYNTDPNYKPIYFNIVAKFSYSYTKVVNTESKIDNIYVIAIKDNTETDHYYVNVSFYFYESHSVGDKYDSRHRKNFDKKFFDDSP